MQVTIILKTFSFVNDNMTSSVYRKLNSVCSKTSHWIVSQITWVVSVDFKIEVKEQQQLSGNPIGLTADLTFNLMAISNFSNFDTMNIFLFELRKL